MDIESRISLVLRNSSECVTEADLRRGFETREHPRAYVGYEPSGHLHIGQALVHGRKLLDMQEAGVKNIVYLADWHALINDKLEGNHDAILACGRYLAECFGALGVEAEYVEASAIVDKKEYWERVIRIAKASSLQRIKRALTIMGRTESEADTDSSKIIYPAMQAADIFDLDLDIAMAGMDQRKAHMLARDAAEKLGWTKFAALHTPLLPNLKGGARMDPIDAKMSKSDPNSSVLVHDSPKRIRKKLNKAFCPIKAEDNPVLILLRDGVFPWIESFHIDRPDEYGGPLDYATYQEVEKAFLSEELHPGDLKGGVASAVAEILAPIRERFPEPPGFT